MAKTGTKKTNQKIYTTVIRNPHGVIECDRAQYFASLIGQLETQALDREYDSHLGCIDKAPKWVHHEGRDGRGRVYYVRALPAGVWHMQGSFINSASSFSIYTNDPEVIDLVANAMRVNKRRASYRSQPKPRPDTPTHEELFDSQIIEDWAEDLNTDVGHETKFIRYGM